MLSKFLSKRTEWQSEQVITVHVKLTMCMIYLNKNKLQVDAPTLLWHLGHCDTSDGTFVYARFLFACCESFELFTVCAVNYFISYLVIKLKVLMFIWELCII